ncbi:MAG: bifunctional oligoribonuclease/PAP phosphatase NrnA [Treponema sp.]|jgi:phosphoesterase RecJ-like protein|nr:bifunctional oligoribonuclease/PAP phosphatase NrnA [Treponema sp.]
MVDGEPAKIQNVPDELIQFIKTGSKFIVAGHKEPDGDCVGSQLALRSALVRLGKEAICCSAGPFKRSEIREYEPFFSTPPQEKDARLIIVDCSGIERLGDLEKKLEGLPVAVIDHHAAGTHLPSTPQAPVYLDADTPSCALLVYNLINALELEPSPEEAKMLLFGICTDSGFFRHLTEKSAGCFKAVAELIRLGASPKETYQKIYGGKKLDSRIFLGHTLSRTESHFDGKLLVSHETLEEFNEFGFEGRDSDSLNQLLQTVSGIEATVIIRQELADACTVSLRSTDKIDVAQIAASFGGGGHKNAAGLTMKGNVSFVKEKVLESFKNIFHLKA